jgi:hypothetical protein
MVITNAGMRCVVYRASGIRMSTEQCHRIIWRGPNPSPDRLTFDVKPGWGSALTFHRIDGVFVLSSGFLGRASDRSREGASLKV